MPPQLGHSILHAHAQTRTAHAHARAHGSALGVGNAWPAAALRARKGRPSRSNARRVPWHPGPKMGPRCGFDQAGSRSDAPFARARPPAWPLASRLKNCPARTGPVDGGEPARRPTRAWPGERDIPLLQHINGASVSRAGQAPGIMQTETSGSHHLRRRVHGIPGSRFGGAHTTVQGARAAQRALQRPVRARTLSSVPRCVCFGCPMLHPAPASRATRNSNLNRLRGFSNKTRPLCRSGAACIRGGGRVGWGRT